MGKYKLNKDGYYRTSVTVKDNKGNPKRIFLRAKTEEELTRLKYETEFMAERGEICFNENTKFKKYAEEWIEVYKKDSISEKSYKTLKANLDNHLCPTLGNMPLIEIKPIHCQRALNRLAGQSVSLVNKVRQLLTGILEQAVEDECIIKNPARKLNMPKTTEGSYRSITEHEREHILKVAEWHRGGLWVLTMLYTGCRPKETRYLNWADVDFKNGRLFIDGTKSDAAKRRVPLPPELLDRFRQEFKKAKTTFIFHQKKDETKPHTETSMRRMWENFKRELDISMGAKVYNNKIILSVVAHDLVPYCMRHTYATDCQTAGVPINIAKVLMGHSDIKTTGDIYTDYTQEHEKQVTKTLNAFWGCAKGVPKQEENA